MTTKIRYNDNEIVVDSENQFRKVINDFGADGRVWFDKKFICDYINALYLKIERLELAFKDKADVKGVVRGKWIQESYPRIIKCSVCGMTEVIGFNESIENATKRFPYCHCGADMGGSK